MSLVRNIVSPEFLLKESLQNTIEKRRPCQKKSYFLLLWYLLILQHDRKDKEGKEENGQEVCGSEVYEDRRIGTDFAVNWKLNSNPSSLTCPAV